MHTFDFITLISLTSILRILFRREIILFHDLWVQRHRALEPYEWSKRTEESRFAIGLDHTGWFNGFYQWEWGFQLLLDFFDVFLLGWSLLLLRWRGGILGELGREKFHNKNQMIWELIISSFRRKINIITHLNQKEEESEMVSFLYESKLIMKHFESILRWKHILTKVNTF